MVEGRSLGVIASEIRKSWVKLFGTTKLSAVNPAAKPYLDAMATLRSVEDNYYHDSGKSVVRYFLANATSWRGEDARRIKAELKRLLGD